MFNSTRDRKARKSGWRMGLAPALLLGVGWFAAHPVAARAAPVNPLSEAFATDDTGVQPANANDAAPADPAAAPADATTPPAAPSDSDALASAFSGDSGFQAMDNKEMAGERGGMDGIEFGIFLTGTLNTPVGTPLPPGITTPSPGQIQILGGLGNLAGANGIFQITNVIGDMNVINNNIIINVTIQNSAPGNTTTIF
ncbi:MAG: hypothetical protein ACHP7N_08115 [Caulobacterales bacterium]